MTEPAEIVITCGYPGGNVKVNRLSPRPRHYRI